MLQKTHLSSGSEDGEGPSSSGRTDDDDEDIDLDEMASDLLPKVCVCNCFESPSWHVCGLITCLLCKLNLKLSTAVK